MANKNPLSSWLYLNKKELNPKFIEFTWPKRILPDLFDFSTTIEWNGLKAEGRGVEQDRELALEKSIAEAIERLVCHQFNHNSVGMAVAGSFDPTGNAKNEAYERYFLVHHIKNNLPFDAIEFKNDLAKKFIELNPNAQISFFKMLTSKDTHGVVCSISSTNNKTRALGFSLTESTETSAYKAMIEALPNYAWILEDNDELLKRHLPWHLRKDFLDKIEPLIENSDSVFKNFLALPKLKKIEIPISNIPILKTPEIQIARYVVDEEFICE